MSSTITTIKMFLWMTFITGLLYPLTIFVIAQLAMPHAANGSLVSMKGKPVGSRLLAQKNNDARYFWPRPSSIDYNTLQSGGSNLGPTSKTLKKIVEERKIRLMEAYHLSKSDIIPVELLYSSGSGLDPHLSVAAAYFQSERIAKARSLELSQVHHLIEKNTRKNLWGLFGPAVINVLELNIALDKLNLRKTDE